jgi:hypothetical protein
MAIGGRFKKLGDQIILITLGKIVYFYNHILAGQPDSFRYLFGKEYCFIPHGIVDDGNLHLQVALTPRGYDCSQGLLEVKKGPVGEPNCLPSHGTC